MSDRLEEFGDTAVAVVTFGTAEAAEGYRRHLGEQSGVSFPFLVDVDKRFYRAFELGRGSAWAVWGPRNLAAYRKLLADGRRLRRPTEGDMRQLGGDFVFDADGGLSATFRPATPDQRPSVDELIAAIAAT